jgi:NAD(P)-dependent dehydrogenase (short-subunit alcohol dehydrogenase family)
MFQTFNSFIYPFLSWLLVLSIVLYIIRKLFLVGVRTNLKRLFKNHLIIVTGSSAGVGKATAIQLLEDGAEVIFACRNKTKTMSVINSLPKKFQKRSHFIELDLSSFKSVVNFAKELKSKFSKVDILINNAASYPMEFTITRDNIEDIIQGNLLGHILLSVLLLDHFDPNHGRIINVASFAHSTSDLSVDCIAKLEEDLKFKTIVPYFSNMWNKHHHYSNTKLGNIIFSNFLSKYVSHNYPHIKVASLNPGLVYTEIARFFYEHKIYKYVYKFLFPLYMYIAKTPLHGAQTSLHLCYLQNEEFINGGYYSDCKLKKPSSLSLDSKIIERYMLFSINLIKRCGLKEVIDAINTITLDKLYY